MNTFNLNIAPCHCERSELDAARRGQEQLSSGDTQGTKKVPMTSSYHLCLSVLSPSLFNPAVSYVVSAAHIHHDIHLAFALSLFAYHCLLLKTAIDLALVHISKSNIKNAGRGQWQDGRVAWIDTGYLGGGRNLKID